MFGVRCTLLAFVLPVFLCFAQAAFAQSEIPVGYFELPPDPSNVVGTADQAQAASAEIGPSGGSIVTTDAAGIRYELVVPADALAESIQISIAPIASIDGKPAPGAGLLVEPHGVQLAVPGMLTVSGLQASQRAELQLLSIGYGVGEDLRNEIALRRTNELQVTVDHFTIFCIDRSLCKPSPMPTSDADRFRHAVAAAAALYESSTDKVPEHRVVSDLLREFVQHSVKALGQNPDNTEAVCRSIRSSILAYKNANDLINQLRPANNRGAWPILDDRLRSALTGACRKEAEFACKTRFDLGTMLRHANAERYILSQAGAQDNTIEWLNKLKDDCYRFEISYSSKVKFIYTDPANLDYKGDYEVFAKGLIELENPSFKADQEFRRFDFVMIDNVSHCKNRVDGKKPTSVRPVEVRFETLKQIVVGANSFKIALDVDPGTDNTRVTYTDKCSGKSDLDFESLWGDSVKDVHGGTVPFKMEVPLNTKSYPIIGTATLNKKGPSSFGIKGEASETLTIEVRHRPK